MAGSFGESMHISGVLLKGSSFGFIITSIYRQVIANHLDVRKASEMPLCQLTQPLSNKGERPEVIFQNESVLGGSHQWKFMD